MISLPQKPSGLKGVKTAVDGLIDYCKSITPKTGKGINYFFGTDGYTAEVPSKEFQAINPDFFVVQYGLTSVRVYDGLRARNGKQLAIYNKDVGKTYATLTGLSTASSTYYVYIQLSHSTAGFHPAVYPDRATVAAAISSDAMFAADSLANMTTSGNVIQVIAKVYTGTNGIYKVQNVRDMDDWVYIPDSYGIAPAGGEQPVSYSIDLIPSAVTPQGYLAELRKFYLGEQTAYTKALDDICFRKGTNNGLGAPIAPFELEYCTLTSLCNAMTPSEIGKSTGSGGDGTIAEYLATGVLDHNNLLFSIIGALGTGKSGGNTDHDDRYHGAFNDGSGVTGHNAFVDDHSYRTTGNYWMSELHLSADGSTDSQHWTAANFLAAVSNSATINATTSGKDLTLGSNDTNRWTNIYLNSINFDQFTVTSWKLQSPQTCDVYFGYGIYPVKTFNVLSYGNISLTPGDGGSGDVNINVDLNTVIKRLLINGKQVHHRYLGDIPQNEKVLTIEV